ncbi:uncharacterized protein F4822DRAFT_430449 [Hypoxylon trugodes]|uniref:uncharacterized protein n=1 Tax=Hypoxylon trugodes TaxID=326681 RepID=UPI002191D993|nr:uncharacterized protein F4822DRAFT_430449 [Hypoxylon trugodes]KAI1387702.1 hypothetical protein F4822DRAFT_430449 [Hypoxylon trugodes]
MSSPGDNDATGQPSGDDSMQIGDSGIPQQDNQNEEADDSSVHASVLSIPSDSDASSNSDMSSVGEDITTLTMAELVERYRQLQNRHNQLIEEHDQLKEDHFILWQNYIVSLEHLVRSMEDTFTKNRRIHELRRARENARSTIRRRDQTIHNLENRIRGIRPPRTPWSQMLRVYYHGEVDEDDEDWYDSIYRESCKQENMSQTLNVFHPDFSLQNEVLGEAARADLLAQDDHLPQAPQLLVEHHPFAFEMLPADIQVKIFGKVFVRRELIHCLSRLDPANPPLTFPDEDDQHRSQLPTRFHFGSSPCQIIRARKPNHVLSALLVCRRWLYIGTHAFYGGNTFAFSSLGEWHRFCNGIGPARVERLANVELMWHGALMPKHPTQISRRTLGLSWLAKTRRLRTLTVHVAERVGGRARRKYENKRANRVEEDGESDRGSFDGESVGDLPSDRNFQAYKLMYERTKMQPNYRGYRSMRTIQGIDYVYQLRGMNWVRFKERNGLEHRQIIRDWSFIKDINTLVALPKQVPDALKSEIENLTPLSGLAQWIPSNKDVQMAKAFYDEDPNADPIAGSETSESDHGMFGNISDGDSDDDDDSSSGGGDPQNPTLNDPTPNSGDVDIPDQDFDEGDAHELDTPPGSDDDDDDDDDGDDDEGGGNGGGQTNNPASPTGLAGQFGDLNIDTQEHKDDHSERLFVSEGSGPSLVASDHLDVAQAQTAHNRAISSEPSPPEPPSAGLRSAESSGPIVIDLTGDSDDESSLFVRSASKAKSVKTEPNTDVDGNSSPLFVRSEPPTEAAMGGSDQNTQDVTMADAPTRNGDNLDIPFDESESSEDDREDTPPDSDDSDSDDPGGSMTTSHASRPPAKRPSKGRSDVGSKTKRPRLGGFKISPS